jgi:hypothetical protein
MITNCNHAEKRDLTQGLGVERHYYCSKCGAHWYKGREWSRKEWEAWIES